MMPTHICFKHKLFVLFNIDHTNKTIKFIHRHLNEADNTIYEHIRWSYYILHVRSFALKSYACREEIVSRYSYILENAWNKL